MPSGSAVFGLVVVDVTSVSWPRPSWRSASGAGIGLRNASRVVVRSSAAGEHRVGCARPASTREILEHCTGRCPIDRRTRPHDARLTVGDGFFPDLCFRTCCGSRDRPNSTTPRPCRWGSACGKVEWLLDLGVGRVDSAPRAHTSVMLADPERNIFGVVEQPGPPVSPICCHTVVGESCTCPATLLSGPSSLVGFTAPAPSRCRCDMSQDVARSCSCNLRPVRSRTRMGCIWVCVLPTVTTIRQHAPSNSGYRGSTTPTACRRRCSSIPPATKSASARRAAHLPCRDICYGTGRCPLGMPASVPVNSGLCSRGMSHGGRRFVRHDNRIEPLPGLHCPGARARWGTAPHP